MLHLNKMSQKKCVIPWQIFSVFGRSEMFVSYCLFTDIKYAKTNTKTFCNAFYLLQDNESYEV